MLSINELFHTLQWECEQALLARAGYAAMPISGNSTSHCKPIGSPEQEHGSSRMQADIGQMPADLAK